MKFYSVACCMLPVCARDGLWLEQAPFYVSLRLRETTKPEVPRQAALHDTGCRAARLLFTFPRLTSKPGTPGKMQGFIAKRCLACCRARSARRGSEAATPSLNGPQRHPGAPRALLCAHSPSRAASPLLP